MMMSKKLSRCLIALSALSLLVVVPFLVTVRDNGSVRRSREIETRKEVQTTVGEGNYSSSSSNQNSCNLFSGRWVYDNISYPLYAEEQCSLLLEGFACQRNGRKNIKYQQWRWQPRHCDLPRFNGRQLLEKIRGKRVVFVGDSLSRNQWASMVCLLESCLKKSSDKQVIYKGNLMILKATEYNTTIDVYWSPFLVESNCDDPSAHSISNRILRITAIEKHAKHWIDADILIFDSYMWWLHPNMTLIWGSFNDSDAIYKRIDPTPRHYEMSLNTWSDWLEIHINRTRTKLFFMSISPSHMTGDSWLVEQHCNDQTEPIFKEGYRGVLTRREMMVVAESVIQKLETRGVKVEYLNITQLSDYRKDAHPSIYRKFYHPPTQEEVADPKSYADCIHWCLPGVPDVWNHILYSYIINS